MTSISPYLEQPLRTVLEALTAHAEALIPLLPMGGRLSDDLDSMVYDVTPTAWVDEDGLLNVSAEDGKDLADYYGEFRGGCPWVEPNLVKWAEARGAYWEWQNPGAIVLIEGGL